MAEKLDPKELLLAEVDKDNQTNEINHGPIPEGTVTVILKVNEKVYARGAVVGNIEADIPDEDLNSTLRAIFGLGQTVQRTLIELANKPVGYPVVTGTIEEDLALKAPPEA